MKKYFFESKILLFLVLLFTLLFSITEIYFAFVLGDIINVSVSRNSLGFKKYIISAIAIVLCDTIFSYCVKIFRGLFIKNTMISLKKNIFSSIIYKDISSFNSQNSANYISAINNDTNLIEQDYFVNILNGFQYIFLFALGTYSIFKLNVSIAIVVFAIEFIPILIPLLFQKEMGKKKKEYSDSLGSFTTKIKDIFTGFEIIKSFNIEQKIKKDFDNSNNNVEKKKFSSTKLEAIVNSLSSLFGFMAFFVPLSFGTYLTLKGKFTVGGMLTSVQLMNYIVNPILNYSTILNKIKGIKPVNQKIENIINENNNMDVGIAKNSFDESIEFKNVSFSYNDERLILDDINLAINKNEKIAIVGKSGSGKSTLLKLILRQYDNYTGQISIDKQDIKNIKFSSIYKLISIIHQNVFMFDDTIESNIALYNDYTSKEIDKSINLSGLKNLIEVLPNGKETMVGENGSNLSGGEKQRISIARALIKNTPIILLDEATASLDTKTSCEIENSLLNIKELTSVIVTHKLNPSLLKKYDKIIVLDEGKIIEKGNFNELIDNKGYFYNLYSIEKIALPEPVKSFM